MFSFSHNYRYKVRCGLAGCVMMAMVVMVAGVFAQTDEQTAKQAKIEAYIQIAREQVKRGFYTQAKQELDKAVSPEFSSFVTEQQQKQIHSLLETIKGRAMGVRLGDILKEQGRYAQAEVLLRQIEDSPYISAQEKQMVAAMLEDLDNRIGSHQEQMQAVYDAAVRDYKAGRLETARAAFVEVAQSGVSVRGDRPAGDYIAAIDQQLKEQSVMQPAENAAQTVADTQKTVSPAQQTAGEDAAVTTAAQVHAADGPADSDATSSDADTETSAENSYLQVIRRERAVRIDYTTAIVNDALSRCSALLKENRFEDALQILRRAISTVERNKLLLGDELYAEFMAKLNNEEQTINEQQLAWQRKQEQLREEEAAQMTEQIRSTIERQRAEAIENYLDRAFAFQAEQQPRGAGAVGPIVGH